MPWLQLEDEDLDSTQTIPTTPKKSPQPAELEVGTILVVSQLADVIWRGGGGGGGEIL